MKELSIEKNKIEIKNEFDVRSYFLIRQQLEDLAKQYHSFIINPKNLIPFCNPGRLIRVGKFIFKLRRYCYIYVIRTLLGVPKSLIYIVHMSYNTRKKLFLIN